MNQKNIEKRKIIAKKKKKEIKKKEVNNLLYLNIIVYQMTLSLYHN